MLKRIFKIISGHTNLPVIYSHQNGKRPDDSFLVLEGTNTKPRISEHDGHVYGWQSFRLHCYGPDAYQSLVRLTGMCSDLVWSGSVQWFPETDQAGNWLEHAVIDGSSWFALDPIKDYSPDWIEHINSNGCFHNGMVGVHQSNIRV